MGCKESKLAAATIEPVKRPKSASSRSSSRRIDRLDSNTTTTTTTTTTSVATTVAYNEKATNVAEGDEHKKAVESKACQTTGYCSEERIEEKSKNGLIGSNEGGNDAVVSEKETVEDEGDEQDERLVFGEEDKKVESVMVEENENKGEMGEEMKEVGAFEGREQDEVKIEEEEEAQKANDQVQATKVEEAQAGKPSEPKAKAETMVAEEKEEAQDPNDKVEVVEEKGEGQVANDNVEVAEEEEESVEPIEVETETETVVKDETEKIVSSNVDDQVHVAKQGEARDHDGELSEVEAETMVAEDRGEAPNVNDNVMVVQKEEAERTKVEFETKSEEETEMIVPEKVDG